MATGAKSRGSMKFLIELQDAHVNGLNPESAFNYIFYSKLLSKYGGNRTI
jgi:hypothetical protein